MDSQATNNLHALTSTPSTANMPANSLRAKSTEALTQAIHSAGDEGDIANRTRILLKLYYDPDMGEHDRAEMIESYVRALRCYPKWAVSKAFNEWESTGTHRPAPAALVNLASAAVRRLTQEVKRRDQLKLAAEPIAEKTVDQLAAGQRDLIKNGFTPKRFDAVKRKRMAGSEAELYAGGINERTPHWTETVAADSPQMALLRRARAENPMIAESIRYAQINPSTEG